MPKPGDFAFTYYYVVCKDEEIFVAEIDHNAHLVTMLGYEWEHVEDLMVSDFNRQGWKAGTYRVDVFNFEGKSISTLERPLPLPEAWAKLPRSGGPDNKPTHSFAGRVLATYPATTLQVVGEHIEDFGAHYLGEIDTAELHKRSGYQLPEGVRPHHPKVEIDPTTDLAVQS